jgi:hypothetical protein
VDQHVFQYRRLGNHLSINTCSNSLPHVQLSVLDGQLRSLQAENKRLTGELQDERTTRQRLEALVRGLHHWGNNQPATA